MDKSEKIVKIKALQKEISESVKEKRLEEALTKINEILTLAPNLHKIKDLKVKVEKKISDVAKLKEQSKPEVEKKKEDIPVNIEEKNEKIKDAQTFSREKEEKILSNILKMQEEEQEKQVEEILKEADDDSSFPVEDDSIFDEDNNEELASQEMEEKLNKLMNKEKGPNKTGSEVDDIFNVADEADVEQIAQKNISALTKTLKSAKKEDNTKNASIAELFTEPKTPEPEKAEAEKTHPIEETISSSDNDEQSIDDLSIEELLNDDEKVEEKKEEVKAPPAKEEIPSVFVPKADLKQPKNKIEDITLNDIINEHDIKDIEKTEEKEKLKLSRVKKEIPPVFVPKEEIKLPKRKIKDIILENIINERNIANDKKTEGKEEIEFSPVKKEIPPVYSPKEEIKQPEKEIEDIILDDLISEPDAVDIEKTEKKEELKPSPVKKEIPHVFIRKAEEINKEEIKAPSLNKETPAAVQKTDEKKEKFIISHEGGIPTVIGKKKAEKTEEKKYDFKLSGNTGIGGQTDIHRQPVHPQQPTNAPDIDSKMGEFKKEGFNLRNIPQAIGFVFNLERLLISTIGISAAILINILIQWILPLSVSSIAGSLTLGIMFTIISAFIAFTIVKQINEQVHNRFLHHLPQFNKEMLMPSALFWVFWLVIIILLGAIVAIITSVGKFGSVGSVLYSVLSPFNFIFAIILFSLILISGFVSFILPAIIAVDKPGVFSVVKDVMFVLKNHMFTVLGGFLFSAVLNIFVFIATFFVLIGTYLLIGSTLLIINPNYLIKIALKMPPALQALIGQISPDIGNIISNGGGMMQTGMIENFGFWLFIIFMVIGSVFILSVPFIFQNGAAVITFLTIKGKKDIL